nr:hypothetical protein [uncultured Terrisporobacter sp.]
MSKKYIDINELLYASVVNEDLYTYDAIMKSKPNFDKSPRS